MEGVSIASLKNIKLNIQKIVSNTKIRIYMTYVSCVYLTNQSDVYHNIEASLFKAIFVVMV